MIGRTFHDERSAGRASWTPLGFCQVRACSAGRLLFMQKAVFVRPISVAELHYDVEELRRSAK